MTRIHLAAILAFIAPFAASAQIPTPAPTKAAPAKDDVPPELQTPRVDKRTERMRRMIVDGIKAGTLTKGEALSLNNELKRVERKEQTVKQNRQVSPRERRLLHRELNELHERIWRKTHNDTKPPAPLTEE